MTRKEQKEQKLKKEMDFINSIKGKFIDSLTKNKYRLTSVWKTFKKTMFDLVGGVDFLTGRKLKKKWNLHHLRTDSRVYTDTEPEFYICLNPQQHSIWHDCYEEMIKDPTYLDRLKESILSAMKMNDNESFIHHKKT